MVTTSTKVTKKKATFIIVLNAVLAFIPMLLELLNETSSNEVDFTASLDPKSGKVNIFLPTTKKAMKSLNEIQSAESAERTLAWEPVVESLSRFHEALSPMLWAAPIIDDYREIDNGFGNSDPSEDHESEGLLVQD